MIPITYQIFSDFKKTIDVRGFVLEHCKSFQGDLAEVNVAGLKLLLHHSGSILLGCEIDCLGTCTQLAADALQPRHDYDGFASSSESVDNSRLTQGLFAQRKQPLLIFAQDAKAPDCFIVKNPNRQTGYELQNTVEDIFFNSFGTVVDNTVDPLGELVTIKLVFKEVEPRRLWLCSHLCSWLSACSWFLIERGVASFANFALFQGIHPRPNNVMLKLVSWNIQLVAKHFTECFQPDDSLLSRCSTFFDDCMTLYLQNEDEEPVLIEDKTAEVNLSEDAWISTDYSDTVKADYFDPGGYFSFVEQSG